MAEYFSLGWFDMGFPPQDPRPRPTRIEPARPPVEYPREDDYKIADKILGRGPVESITANITLVAENERLKRALDVAKEAAVVRNAELMEMRRALATAAQERDLLNTLCDSLAAQLGTKHTRLNQLMARPVSEFLAARAKLCRYAYLQDEECKLPEGHIGDHGPVHLCNVDCGLSEDGCTLPVPANPVAYYKALYWEIHGGSCPPTCRGHAS